MLLRSLVLLCLATLAACQPAPPPTAATQPPVPHLGVGYLVFSAPIVPRSRDLFIADLDKLVEAGATEIRLAINSPGGEIDAAQGMVDHMARLTARGIRFTAYNVGVVASAASYVFLNAQTRYTAARGTFLFHAAGYVANGPADAQTLRESAAKLDAYERTVRTTLKARSRLTDGEAQTYVRRTVLLNAEDARRDGIVDGVAEFTVPKEARTWVIATRPSTPAPPKPPSSP